MKIKPGVVAFLVFYSAIGFSRGEYAAMVPASTTAGVIFAGAAWPLVDLFPLSWTADICRGWCFDFKEASQ